ncbi:hypothetical protein WR25_12239 isoform B [Diploscapter pachys]|uniref:BTB domain-containing protein n=1 Tax=Diploscapter pachys TaxID=2018661 RepID=A0A2A2KC45_9BILA|nr:hypothetical protein WR25_12239 isoform B [Diploscapter pachys]
MKSPNVFGSTTPLPSRRSKRSSRSSSNSKRKVKLKSKWMISHRLIRNLPRISAIRTFSRTVQRLEEKQTGKSEDPDDFGQIFDTISTTTKKDVQDMSFAKMLRNSKLMQLGGIEGRLVVGRIVDRVVDDLYIDFGFKFNAVCKAPAVNGEAYCIGSHVLLRLHDLELSERFLGSKSDLTLLEADATLVRLLQRRNKEGTTGREQAKATEHTGTEKAGKEQEQNDPNSLPLVNIKITIEDDAGNQKTVTSISDMLGTKKDRTRTIKESDFAFKNLKDQANYMIDENEGIKLTSENFGDFDVNVKFKEDYGMKTSFAIDMENNCVASEEKGISSNTPSRTTPGDVGTSEGPLIVCDIVVDEHANDSTSSKNDLTSVPIENDVISPKEDSDSGIDGSISDFEKKDKNEEKENLESNEGPIDEKKSLKLDRPDRPKKKLTMPKRKKTTSKDSESDATTSQRSEGLHVDTTATALTKDLHSPTSPQPRLFRIQVKDQIFTVDSEYMKELSPIFLTMFYGKDFEKNRELMRVIVDETPNDIRTMLDIIKGSRQIGVKNFALLLRLARKYQITSLLEDCENYVRDLELEKMMGDDILTLLVDSYEYQCSRDVVSQLIVRLAKEGNAQFSRLKISRYLNAQVKIRLVS